MALIDAQNTIGLWLVLIGIVALSFWFEQTPAGRRLSGVIFAMIAGFMLSNLGVIPDAAPVYGVVMSNFVPIALALLLLRVDLRSLRAEAGPILLLFAIGGLGTILGALVAYHAVPLASHRPELAGMFAATYIGGSANFAAVADAFQVTDGDILVPAIASDTIVTILYLIFLGAIPAARFLQARLPQRAAGQPTRAPVWRMTDFNGRGTLAAIVLALVIVQLGGFVQGLVEMRGASILTITLLATVAGTVLAGRVNLSGGGYRLGLALMLVFFAVLGASGSVAKLIAAGPSYLLFAAVVIGVHFVVVFSAGYLFKLDLAEVAIASNACVCGPPTAAGMAADAGWDHLVTPGIIAGSLGFAVASAVGIGVAGWLG